MADEKDARAMGEAAGRADEHAAALSEGLDSEDQQAVPCTSEDAGMQQPVVPAKTPEEVQAALRRRLTSNHGNTLAYLACLKACLGEPRPYREVEESLQANLAFGLSTQTPHTLIGLLVDDGGIERIEVAEEVSGDAGLAADALGDSVMPAELDEAACAPEGALAPADSAVPVAPAAPAAPRTPAEPARLTAPTDPAVPTAPADSAAPAAPDQPIDFLLRTTPAGRAVLDEYDVAARLGRFVAGEPEGYLDAYLLVLDACQGQGASLKQIEQALAGNPALTNPKRVYAGYFISKLETVGAIAWQDAWLLTDDGSRALDALAR